MAFEIAYFTGSRDGALGGEISCESVAIGEDSAQSGATPSNAMIAVISATAGARYIYGADPTAHATSQYLIADLERRIQAVPGAKFSVRDFDALPALSLDNDTVAEDATEGTLVGNIVGATEGSTVTLQAQEDANAFAKDGNAIEVGSAGLDFETNPNPTITLREVLAGYTTRDTVITITVTDVAE
jgi:hypothetical protein